MTLEVIEGYMSLHKGFVIFFISKIFLSYYNLGYRFHGKYLSLFIQISPSIAQIESITLKNE